MNLLKFHQLKKLYPFETESIKRNHQMNDDEDIFPVLAIHHLDKTIAPFLNEYFDALGVNPESITLFLNYAEGVAERLIQLNNPNSGDDNDK